MAAVGGGKWARCALIASLIVGSAIGPLRAEDTGSIALRAEAVGGGPALARLPAGAAVRMVGCTREWCRVRHGDLVGFVRLGELPALLVAPPAPPRRYVNARGATVAAPTDSLDGAAPPGASARCRDGMFSFSRTRSGTCSHHGGVAEWLAPAPR